MMTGWEKDEVEVGIEYIHGGEMFTLTGKIILLIFNLHSNFPTSRFYHHSD